MRTTNIVQVYILTFFFRCYSSSQNSSKTKEEKRCKLYGWRSWRKLIIQQLRTVLNIKGVSHSIFPSFALRYWLEKKCQILDIHKANTIRLVWSNYFSPVVSQVLMFEWNLQWANNQFSRCESILHWTFSRVLLDIQKKMMC